MTALLDANILVRTSDKTCREHREAVQAVKVLRKSGREPSLVPQSLYEFWSVATRPVGKNGLGMAPDEAAAGVAFFKSQFPLLPDAPTIFAEWERLVVAHKVSGKPSHDARYVAAMLVHGVTHILTFNDGDFRRFPEITVLTPAAVIATPP